MDDYIKRNDAICRAIYAADEWDDEWNSGYIIKREKLITEYINEIPAADVRENKRGKWIRANKGYLPMVFACSVCGDKHTDAADMFSF